MKRLKFWRRRRLPVLELHGTIAARAGAIGIAAYASLIDEAIDAAGKGGTLLLDIESPGGSPVQSDLIAQRIRRRAEAKGVKVVAVIGEVGASGGYWLACAGDEIVAGKMSIVGSIGVIGGGFGFTEALDKLGVQRRLYTAGENKARLDPFSPERPQDVAFVHGLLDELHALFKAWVRSRRGAKLTDEAAVFDGGFMLGQRALALGLIDRLGDLDSVARGIGGEKMRTEVFKPRPRGWLARLPRLVSAAVLEAVAEAGAPRI